MSWVKDAVVIDYETLPIMARPHHPPAPVGVAIHVPGLKPRYYAWGHPDGNEPGSFEQARVALTTAYAGQRPLLFHNAKFDVDVGEVHLGLPRLPWDRYHDTMPLLFLRDPRAATYALKPSAEAILGLKPDEQDEVVNWLLANQPVKGRKLSTSKNSDNYAGAFIAFAPPRLVGKYAIGDLTRTRDLAVRLEKEITNRGMTEAYDRERRLFLHTLEMERQGVRVDLKRLGQDVDRYNAKLAELNTWLRRHLKAGEDLNLDSGPQLAGALIQAGFALKADFGVTPTGKMQTNKEALANAVRDPQILAALKFRTQLSTCLHTFMEPWYTQASSSGGFIFTTWHSTRTDRGSGGVGTRTGRLSSTPNWQNVPNEFAPIFRVVGNVDTKTLPTAPIKDLALPLVRSYVLPYAEGEVLLDRDYSQQELRVLAHFEGGVLMEAYLKDPWLDVHDLARNLINGMLGTNFERKPIKNTGFGLIYGMGVGHLAELNNMSVEQAREVKEAYLQIFPGLKAIYQEARRRAEAKQPIRTWGSREYFCEPPQWVDGRMRTYDYKLPNCLVQGSSADITKEAAIRFCETKKKSWRLLLTVHDQLTISAPKREMHQAMECLRTAMEGVALDVPLLSEGCYSLTNWQDLEDYDVKGKKVAA